MSTNSSNSAISAQLQLVLEFIDTINTNNQEKAMSCLSEDFEHHMLPKSLPAELSAKPRSKGGYLADVMKQVLPLLKDLKVTLDEVIEEPGKLAAHASSTAESHTGEPYRNEYTFIFHMSRDPNDGKLKITKWKEIVDSLYTVTFFAEEQKRIANKKLQS